MLSGSYLADTTQIGYLPWLLGSAAFETNRADTVSKEEERKDGAADEDRELVSASRDGDRGAFERLVRRHQGRMMNIAFRMTGDYEEACETVQDTFLSAYRSIKKFRGDAKFSTWLYGICINHAKTRVGQRGRRSVFEVTSADLEREDCNDAPARPGSTFEPTDLHASAVEQLERKALQERIQRCISDLDPEQREVVVLRDIEGFSYEEIVAMLHLPEGTVKSRLFRARDALRVSLKRFIGDY